MLKIDSHQHFWIYDEVRDSWITDEMAVLRADYMPSTLLTTLQQHHFDGSVVIQSDQSPAENLFQIKNAENHPFVKGIVGWVDLQADDIEAQLTDLQQYHKLKGFRHILQGENDRALMLKPKFVNGIGKLQSFGYTYDVLIFPDQLKYAAELAAKFPDQPFVLNHIAKPGIKAGAIEEWKKDIIALAQHENVYCKVSGMVTEADWKHWKEADFRPYLDVVFDAFGIERVMYGSDWPVCLVAASYQQTLGLMEGYTSKLSPDEQMLFWGGNATKFYNL
ncbi:MAG: amidohydrolase family protein [Candidatus Pedobacter colombiensis]|uniref:Amidohydrolase family protein n=1 Tax=Candidatus Pedobacter colombiensis TaxID=3121371 RepID=A0AAJ5W9P0_9SPHI|nr:amidohydrolase family protein [Pedobacter sp.]WEK19630.1 MAG: amidohydrolase family protein [Pedobacter sp.]